MFLNNKYTKWYYNIINKANSENRVKSIDNYYEKHRRNMTGNKHALKNKSELKI